jgi:NAD-dependent SIR2 family protein deacetylase
MALSKINIPTGIKEAFGKNKAGIYVGAGVSASVGLPIWNSFLKILIEKVEEINIVSAEKKKDLYSLLADNAKFLTLAEELKELLSSDFYRIITELFKETTPDPSDLHEEIIKLPSRFIITTNYDNLLEKAYIKIKMAEPNKFSFYDATDLIYYLFNEKHFILKAHGDAGKARQGIILTEKDYREILFNNLGYKSILENLFLSHCIIFLGTSLTDPELLLLLKYVQNVFEGGNVKHYALIDKKHINQTEVERWKKDYNIEVLKYDPHDNHIEVLNFLKDLSVELK